MSNDSFIREVEEELRSDRLKSAWDRFGPFIIGGAVAITLATAGYVGWRNYSAAQASKSSDAYLQAINLANDGKSEEAIAALDALKADGHGQYPVLAKLRTATVHAAAGETDKAIAIFDEVGNDTSAPLSLREAAKVRAAYILVDTGSYEDVAARVETLTADANPYRHSAREALAMAAYKAERFDDAAKLITTILNDDSAPRALSERAGVLLDLMKAAGKVSEG